MKKMIVPLLIGCLFILVAGCGTGNKTNNSAKEKSSGNVEFSENDYQKISSSNNQLGFDLFSQVEANDEGNTFISPTSLFIALSMVYNGADGVTKDEIAKVLHSKGMDANELSKANASLMSILARDSKKIKLNIANSIWLNENYHFQTDFANRNRDYFKAKIQEIDVNDKQSNKMINDWVEKSTNGKIKEMFDPKKPLDPAEVVAILINAIYFKGDWMYEFDKKQTEKRSFHLEDGTIEDRSLMKLEEELAYFENDNFQAVDLPYGDGEMSMKVFLPKEDSSLAQFEKMLTDDNWKKWNAEFTEQTGTIQLPKFQIEYEAELNDSLKKLGMPSAFKEYGANFSKLIKSSDPIWISKAKQKTFIDVNEEGSEAAAATSITLVTESSIRGFQMEVNRPFFIAITDNETDTIVFMGSITNPLEGK